MASKTISPPSHIARIPDRSINAVLDEGPVVISAKQMLYRAAWNVESIIPTMPVRFYRFGPPKEIVSSSRKLPYWWLYVAEKPLTAVCEAQFLRSDATDPGHFRLDEFAIEHGLIARLSFPVSLRLLSLQGPITSRLGIYDLINSPDHEWCQWFGYQLHRLVFSKKKMKFDGVLYPSRKIRGASAIALSSRFLHSLTEPIKREFEFFHKTPTYRDLSVDKLRTGKQTAFEIALKANQEHS